MYTFGAGDNGYSIALDEINQMLYVGAGYAIFKLSAGDATQLPTYLHTLPLGSSAYNWYGIAVDPATGYGTCKDHWCQTPSCMNGW